MSTGTFRYGRRDVSEMESVLPLNWTVNCDAPITVALMRSVAGCTGAGRAFSAILRLTASANAMARSPKSLVSLP